METRWEIKRDIEQGTDEWHEMRLGVITGSKFKDVLAKGKGLTRSTYMRQLAAERLTGLKEDSYTNDSMKWGTETEPQARAMYELAELVDVDEVTFIRRSDGVVGVSPDGLVGDNGGVEFKCPKTTTQIETFLSGKMPTAHIPQVQGCIWAGEREWWDFVSFDPRINGQSGYFKQRIYRDDKYIKALSEEVDRFYGELFNLIEKLR